MGFNSAFKGLIISEFNAKQHGDYANYVYILLQCRCLYNKSNGSSSNIIKNNSKDKRLALEFFCQPREKNTDFSAVYALVLPRAFFPSYVPVVI
jgi:hypothetical protein